MKDKSILGTLQLLGISVALGTLSACASTGDVSSAKAAADNASQTANAAQSTASSAAQKADTNEAKINQTTQLAQNASADANRAMQGVKEVNEKLDRMFKKGMKK